MSEASTFYQTQANSNVVLELWPHFTPEGHDIYASLVPTWHVQANIRPVVSDTIKPSEYDQVQAKEAVSLATTIWQREYWPKEEERAMREDENAKNVEAMSKRWFQLAKTLATDFLDGRHPLSNRKDLVELVGTLGRYQLKIVDNPAYWKRAIAYFDSSGGPIRPEEQSEKDPITVITYIDCSSGTPTPSIKALRPYSDNISLSAGTYLDEVTKVLKYLMHYSRCLSVTDAAGVQMHKDLAANWVTKTTDETWRSIVTDIAGLFKRSSVIGPKLSVSVFWPETSPASFSGPSAPSVNNDSPWAAEVGDPLQSSQVSLYKSGKGVANTGD